MLFHRRCQGADTLPVLLVFDTRVEAVNDDGFGQLDAVHVLLGTDVFHRHLDATGDWIEAQRWVQAELARNVITQGIFLNFAHDKSSRCM